MGASGSELTLLFVTLIGSGGLMGSAVALVKLRGDKDTAAVSQAHGANEALVATLAAVERERDYWKSRYEQAAGVNAELRRALQG